MTSTAAVAEFADGLGRPWSYSPELVQVWAPHAGDGKHKAKQFKTRYVSIGRVRVWPQWGWGLQRFDSLVEAQTSCTLHTLRGGRGMDGFNLLTSGCGRWTVPQAVKDVATWPGMTFRIQGEEWPFGLERVQIMMKPEKGRLYPHHGITGAVWLLAHCGFPEERHNTLEAALAALRAR